MKKVLVVLAMAMALSVSGASVSMARIAKCTVKAVDGDTVTMECKRASLKAGDDVIVKPAKKKRAIEGC